MLLVNMPSVFTSYVDAVKSKLHAKYSFFGWADDLIIVDINARAIIWLDDVKIPISLKVDPSESVE